MFLKVHSWGSEATNAEDAGGMGIEGGGPPGAREAAMVETRRSRAQGRAASAPPWKRRDGEYEGGGGRI
eukprot:9022394-Pyramimonas_sp.AAC.1